MATSAELSRLIRSAVRRVWDSPTGTTWASTISRAAGVLLVLPLVVKTLTTAEIAVWYLFASVISLQLIADAGFAPTFTRLIAYAMAGASVGSGRSSSAGSNGPDYPALRAIWLSTHRIYNRLALIALTLFGTLGTWSLFRPIHELQNPSRGWVAWVIILIGTATVLRGNALSAFLQGVNEVALLRRWEALTSIASTTTSVIVLLSGGGLVGLALATQGWAIAGVARNFFLSRYIQRHRLSMPSQDISHFGDSVWREAWPPAWRSAVGIGMSRGVVYVTGLIYAQVADAGPLASYLLAIRLITAVAEFAQGPFYSKLPLLAQQFASGRFPDLVQTAERGMRLALWSFVVGFVGVGVAGSALLRLIGSRAEFVSQPLWVAIGVAFYLERYGAMHLQLFSTTGEILWHVANGVAGALNIVAVLALYRLLGVMAFPVGIVAGNVLFYCWYCARLSYGRFGMRFWSFELKTSVGPTAAMLLYVAIVAIVALRPT